MLLPNKGVSEVSTFNTQKSVTSVKGANRKEVGWSTYTSYKRMFSNLFLECSSKVLGGGAVPLEFWAMRVVIVGTGSLTLVTQVYPDI